jgi:hypothetical protein
MMNTDTTLLEWVKTNDLAESLETATGVPVLADQKKHLLLSGLLPEFKLKKQMIQAEDKGNTLTLSQCVDDLIDYANEENLMGVKKGISQRKNQSFYGEANRRTDSKSNGQLKHVTPKAVPQMKGGFRERLATQPCRHWAAGVCAHGVNCYRRHEGPGGCTADAPTTKSATKGPGTVPTPFPTPSAPPHCHYCSTTGHAMKDCPDFKRLHDYNREQAMYANDKHDGPAFSFPVMHEEELPDNEVHHHHDTPFQILKVLMFSMVASIFYLCMGAFPDFRRLLKSCVPTNILFSSWLLSPRMRLRHLHRLLPAMFKPRHTLTLDLSVIQINLNGWLILAPIGSSRTTSTTSSLAPLFTRH